MKTIKCMLTAVLLGCSALSFAQTSSDVEAWKGVRFSYDLTTARLQTITWEKEKKMQT